MIYDEDKEFEPAQESGCAPVGITAIIVFFLILTIVCSCSTTKYVPVESVRTEYRDRLQHDSIYVKDSVYIREKGDTVFFEKWQTKYVERLRVDSFIRHDSVQVPYIVEVIKKVPKELSWWQSIKMELGGWLFGALFIVLVYFGIKIAKSVKSVGWKAALKLIFKI